MTLRAKSWLAASAVVAALATGPAMAAAPESSDPIKLTLNDWTGRTKRGAAAWGRLDVVEGRAERLRDRLGLDPQARARQGLTVARTQVAQRSEHQPPDERVQAEIADLEALIAELEAGEP